VNPRALPPPSRLAALLVASVGGLGYIAVAPGTFGSAAGLALWAVIPSSTLTQLMTMAGLFVIGSWSSGAAEKHFGRTDPSQVVIDEVLGMLITLFMNPVAWPGASAGFVLFRLFDVVKPFPANRLERLPGGVGVMADDAMAAIYANLTLRILLTIRIW
jgi:phosphatidylglycerophosphatase A